MRYGEPSVASALDALKPQGATRILVLPLYPQYAAATTASAFDAVAAWARRVRRVPELRFVDRLSRRPRPTSTALATRVHRALDASRAAAGMLVLSFHGMPRALADAG